MGYLSLFYNLFFMAKLIEVVNTLDGKEVPVLQIAVPVKAGAAASIKAGYQVIVDGSNAGYAKAAPDGTDSTSLTLGVASEDSTETASVDGTVMIYTAPVLLVRIKAKTPGSLVATMKLTNKYALDVTTGNYTLDQGTTSNGIFTLLDYDNTTDGNCLAALACNKFVTP